MQAERLGLGLSIKRFKKRATGTLNPHGIGGWIESLFSIKSNVSNHGISPTGIPVGEMLFIELNAWKKGLFVAGLCYKARNTASMR